MIHKAKYLLPEQKKALERLVGRAISDQEEVSVRVLRPPPSVSRESRAKILDELKAYFAQVDAQRTPAPLEQADEITDEALRSVRPGYRRHR